jgi:hypothetical protein
MNHEFSCVRKSSQTDLGTERRTLSPFSFAFPSHKWDPLRLLLFSHDSCHFHLHFSFNLCSQSSNLWIDQRLLSFSPCRGFSGSKLTNLASVCVRARVGHHTSVRRGFSRHLGRTVISWFQGSLLEISPWVLLLLHCCYLFDCCFLVATATLTSFCLCWAFCAVQACYHWVAPLCVFSQTFVRRKVYLPSNQVKDISMMLQNRRGWCVRKTMKISCV